MRGKIRKVVRELKIAVPKLIISIGGSNIYPFWRINKQ